MNALCYLLPVFLLFSTKIAAQKSQKQIDEEYEIKEQKIRQDPTLRSPEKAILLKRLRTEQKYDFSLLEDNPIIVLLNNQLATLKKSYKTKRREIDKNNSLTEDQKTQKKKFYKINLRLIKRL